MAALPRIVFAVDADSHGSSAFYWIRDDPIGLSAKDLQIDIVHAVSSDKDAAHGNEILANWDKIAQKEFKDRFVVKTKLIRDDQGIGHGIKTFCNEIKARLLVITSSRKSFLKRHLMGSVSDYLQHHCQCPVIIVKKARNEIYDAKFKSQPAHVALAIDHSVHSDHAVEWFLSTADLPRKSTLVLLHVVRKASEKPDARKFLASFKPRCLESKKDFTMKSGLVYFKGKKPAESILKYCNDYNVDLLIVAAKMQGGLARLQGSIADSCVQSADCDVLVWKDDRTRRLSISADPLSLSQSKKTEDDDYDVAMVEVGYPGYEKVEAEELEPL